MHSSSKKQPVENLTSLWSFIMKITAKENNLNDMQLSYKHAFFQEPLRIGLQTHVSRKQRF